MSISATGLWSRGGKIARVVRLKPFNTSTEEGRSQERFRRVALTALASMAARAINLAVLVVSVPLTLRYLGVERYGLWMTITSFTTLLAFADLGMGTGIQNAVSRADGNNDRETAHDYVSSGFFMLAGLSAFLLVLFFAAYRLVPWAHLLNVHSPTAAAEAGPTVAVFASCFALNIVFGIVQRVQLGYQEGFNSSVWQCAASLLGLACLLLALHQRAGLPFLVLAAVGAPIFGLACNGVWLFTWRHRWLRPALARVSLGTCRRVFGVGVAFLVLQVGFAVGFSSDNLIVSHTLGASRVAEYSICVRLFAVVTLLVSMSTSPLWPAYTEAYTRGNFAWIQSTVRRSALLALVAGGLLSAVLAAFGRTIIHHWAGHAVVPSLALLWGMAAWVTLDTLRATVSNLLNALHVLKFQAYLFALFAVVSITAKVAFGHRLGLAGIMWAGVGTYLLCFIGPSVVYTVRVLARLGQSAPAPAAEAAPAP